MKIAYFWLTSQGKSVVEKIQKGLGGQIESKQHLKMQIAQDFEHYDALVFVMATGIVVRMLADLIQSKTTDPAVIVLDQQGKFVISLLSGHMGGANALACEIAAILGAVPVITTATDTEGLVAIDIFAKKNHLKIENPEKIKIISSTMLRNETITIYSDLDLQDYEKIIRKIELPAQVMISDRILKVQENVLILRPKSLVIGIGCKKNITFQALESCFLELLNKNNLSVLSVFKIATISLKAQEPAILELCQKYQLVLEIIPDEKIKNASQKFESSAFVEKITGLPSVAEACSYFGSDQGESLTGKVKFSGITLAICRKKLEKLYFTSESM
ncbi:MAG: cobalt-precorrin 5A hydrolase [Oscillospiraceae bacterium]|nr:cobalt-precorrin 5A hydrolase [Oscillospiraceae bacterium]